MHWLNYVFFGLMLALGATAFVLYLRAKDARAWIWVAIALVGAAGIAGLLAGRADGAWRTLALSAVFYLFAVDHLVQHMRSQRSGSPKKTHLWLGIGWLMLGVLTAIDLG